ncbi:MAG: hypothetical protein K5663_04995 [Clostridiales bacterium]|nr:hypothetical protein [Clostridiales bacterium]
MYTLREYSDLLRRLVPREAFVRLDRDSALFISDYPLRCPGFMLDDPEFAVESRGGLAHIFPRFDGAPETLKADLPKMYKTAELTDKRLRQRLALALRLGRTDESDYIKRLLEHMEAANEDQMAGTRML